MNRGRIIALGAPGVLKEELRSHVLMALDSSDPLESMKALEMEKGVLDVAVYGAGLHVTVRDAAEETRIRQALDERGIAIRRLEVIHPSMEDVFVAMIQQEERRAS